MPSRKNPDLNRKKGLYLKHAGIKGRGVFCRTPIKAGEILEVAPAVILNQDATKHVDKTIMLNYTFMVGSVSKAMRRRAGLKKTGKSSAVILGIMSFCNHGEHPNAEILWEERDGTVYYILEATRAIPRNTEICTTYGKYWFADRK